MYTLELTSNANAVDGRDFGKPNNLNLRQLLLANNELVNHKIRFVGFELACIAADKLAKLINKDISVLCTDPHQGWEHELHISRA